MSLPQELLNQLMKEGWKLLQNRVCRNYRATQRGSGVGGVFNRRNGHRMYPLQALVTSESDGNLSKETCKQTPISIEMVTPAAATVTQAKQELAHIKEDENAFLPQSKKKRKASSNKPAKIPRKKSKTASPLFEKGLKSRYE